MCQFSDHMHVTDGDAARTVQCDNNVWYYPNLYQGIGKQIYVYQTILKLYACKVSCVKY